MEVAEHILSFEPTEGPVPLAATTMLNRHQLLLARAPHEHVVRGVFDCYSNDRALGQKIQYAAKNDAHVLIFEHCTGMWASILRRPVQADRRPFRSLHRPEHNQSLASYGTMLANRSWRQGRLAAGSAYASIHRVNRGVSGRVNTKGA